MVTTNKSGSNGKSGTSAFLKKMGSKLKKAHEQHKDDETKYGSGGDLPGGVTGRARLTEIKIGQYEKGDNKGESFFYAAGTVISPKEFKGAPIQGCRTSIGPEPLCDTPGKSRETFDDHWGWVLNELRKLGVDTKDMDEESLDSVLTELKESGPVFKFSTSTGKPSKEYPEPRVFHNWNGIDEDYVEEEDEDVEEEEETDKEEEKEEDNEENENEEEKQELPEGIDELAELAEEGNEEAQAKLTEIASESGLEQEEIEGADNWAALVEMIQEKQGGETKEDKGDDDEEENKVPKKGDTFKYKPVDPKTKKPGKKTFDVEVIAVDTKKETVTLKNLDDNKTKYMGIKFSDLISD